MFPYRRTSRASLVPVIQVLSLVLVFALPVVWGARIYTSTPAHYERITVKSGDTLWSIVARRTAAGDDLGERVYGVAAANHIGANQSLKPGQVILVPR